MSRGLVLSDLHLLAKRADFSRWQDDVFARLANVDFCVLNGDVFDFKWSFLATYEQSFACAIKWLENLLQSFPSCRFYYVLGNHDSMPEFVALVEQNFANSQQLSIHPDLLKLGNNIFLHGDVCHMIAGAGDLETQRTRFHGTDTAPKGRAMNLLYDALIYSRLHHLGPLVNSPAACSQKVLNYIRNHSSQSSLLNGATDVYMGHTHRAFANFNLAGLCFHNTGSAIRGLKLFTYEITL